MILISFNGPVIKSHSELYSQFFDRRLNPNRCPIKASFFVNDNIGRNDFKFAQQLYTKGIFSDFLCFGKLTVVFKVMIYNG